MKQGAGLPLMAPEAFTTLALDAQLAWLANARDHIAPPDLLALTAAARDHAPLAWLARALLDDGWLDDDPHPAELAAFLLNQPDTAIHKVLRQLVEPPPDRARRPALRRLLEAAWHDAPLERLAAMCLIDRTFKHHFVEERDLALARRLAACAAALTAGHVDAVPLAHLAQLPGRRLEALRDAARTGGGQGGVDRFDALRATLASRAIALLGDAPKAVSQANAEELLARRVYTDPGHFLVELLQNAEDAGARRWHVDFLPRRVVVWHDGAPFDARDLVGVTSIGQTTKRKTQIGFFGVGFKSVYEITDRPQLFSDAYLFEIADVSIPKRLAARPPEVPADGTVLILPLRDPDDPARSARALYDKAVRLDPIVLLTLRSVRTIALRCVDVSGAEVHHTLAAEQADDHLVTVRQTPAQWSRTFAVHSASVCFDHGPREAARTNEAVVMIGVQWTDGAPAPLPDTSPTVYSWLPTAEPSGLRFFVQSHFDVPVDRERIAPDSTWNRWILSHIPALLADLARHLNDPGGPRTPAERARGFLDVLPLADDLDGPHWRPVAADLRHALFTLPCLPAADGTVRPPEQLAVATPAVAAVLDGLPLLRQWLAPTPDQPELPCHMLAPDLPDRALEVARQLGCVSLDADRLLGLLERALHDPSTAGGRLRDALASDPDRLARLYDLLLDHLDHLDRAGHRVTAARTLERLGRLPLLLDSTGGLLTADAVCRGTHALRAITADSPRRWLSPRLDPLLPHDDRPVESARLAALYDRLEVATFGLNDLLTELQRQLPAPTLDPAESACPPLLAAPTTRLALLHLTLDGSWADLHLAAHLPLFLATDGLLYPAARDATDRSGVVRPGTDALAARLRAFWGHRRPILQLDPGSDVQEEVLARLAAPILSIDTLVFDLWTTPPVFPLADEPDLVLTLHALLADVLPDLPARARERLAALPIWPDADGLLHPLTGSPAAVRVPVDDAVAALFPAVPFLAAPLRELAHVRPLGAEVVGVEAVIGALAPDAPPPLTLQATPHVLAAALAFILDHAGHVRERSRRRLLVFPAFLDDLGRPRTIGELCLASPPRLRDLFAGWADRRFIDPDGLAMQVVLRLDLAAHLQPVDVANLVNDLHRAGRRGGTMPAWLAQWLPPERHTTWLHRVQQALVDQRDTLAERFPPAPRPGLPPANPVLNGLPIWTASGAVLAASEVVASDLIASLTDPDSPEHAYIAGRTLTGDGASRFAALQPLIAGRPPVDLLVDLIDALARDGQPLSAQPGFLNRVDKVVKVITLLADARDVPVASRLALVDAAGRLRLAPLHNTDAETRALINPLPLADDLVHPDLTDALTGAPDALKALVAARLSALEPVDVIAAVERHVTAPDRAPEARDALLSAFWRWLVSHEREVFTNAECRQRLRQAPLFLTGQSRLVSAADLVIDTTGAVPTDLGMDWAPSPAIPDATLQRLVRNLDVGQPEPTEIVGQHLLPAYLAAALAPEHDRAGKLLTAIERLLRGQSWDTIRALLTTPDGGGLPLEDNEGRFRPPAVLMLPGPDLLHHVRAVWGDDLPAPSTARYPDELHPFLLALGVKRTPSLADLRDALDRPGLDRDASRGLAALCGALHRDGVDLLPALPLQTLAWAADGTGGLRRPDALILWTAELEALIGARPELYVDEMIPLLLGRELTASLGFRGAPDLRLSEVVHHLRLQSHAHEPTSFALYRWLERGLTEGHLDPHELATRLGPMAWICTDDGEYFDHRRTLGARALRLFGTRRGSWERGREQCPALCKLFGIPAEVTPEVVLHFLEEVATDVRQRGDQWALDRERALPRMLLACFAWLGRAGHTVPDTWPVILCHGAGTLAGTRLLPASSPGLLRSDTPTLEALFAPAGPFYLADTAEGDERAPVDAFLERAGVARLRDAYSVVTEVRADQDRTAHHRAELLQLRAMLAALLDVLPRIQLQRAQLDPDGWVHTARLRPLATTGAIAAIEDLHVYYALPGVGRVPAHLTAAWERDRGRLLVDTRALAALDQDTTGLAVGLMATIYRGRGEEQLVDLVELLLPFRSGERMHRYLDRRHFPVAQRRQGPLDRLARRVGELLDYELHLRLQRRFDALRHADFAAWRDPALLDPLRGSPDAEPAASPGRLVPRALALRAAERLLDALRAEPDELEAPDLLAALVELLSARTLSDIAVAWLGADWLHDAPTPDRPPLPLQTNLGPQTLSVLPASGPTPETTWDPIDWDAVLSASQPRQPPGVFQRLSQWLGIADEPPPSPPAGVTPPAWARQGGNCLAPIDAIPPQLWATASMRQRLGATPPGARLAYEPSPLPTPWLYGIHTLGASFDRRTQSWTPTPIPSRRWFADLQPTGHRVRFGGHLQPGWSQLPIPMLSRLVGPPQAVDGTPIEAEPTEPWATQRVFVPGSTPVEVHFTVELLEAPPLTAGQALTGLPTDLLQPVLARRDLPHPGLRRWLEREAAIPRSPWERALSVQSFVRTNYRHDEGFLDDPQVHQALAALRPGVGYHHLELLHASHDDEHLGRGICYELNSLVVELLRHLRVPALVASGWIFDLGVVDRPDHLFAVVITPTAAGPCLMPIDGSSGAHGPMPILPHHRDAPSTFPTSSPAPAPIDSPWSFPDLRTTDLNANLDALRAAEDLRLRRDAALLFDAIALISRVHGQPLPDPILALRTDAPAIPADALAARLRQLVASLLNDPDLVQPMLRLLRRDFLAVNDLDPHLQELVRRGYARVQTRAVFAVEAV